MAASRGAFDDEAVHASAGFFGEGKRQSSGGNNPQKEWTFELGSCATTELLRVEGGGCFFTGKGAFNVNREGRSATLGEEVEGTGNGAWDARTHEDVVGVREHGTVE